MDDFTWRQVDKYRLIRHLGQGSFGEVFLAEHVSRHTRVALKLLRARLSRENMVDFLNEARAVRLQHANIVRILDFGLVEDVPFLVMDYIPGGTMRQRHPFGSRLPLATVVEYARQISAALQYAHDEGLVHRDVKPENMLIGPNNEILLNDFGIVTTSYTWSPGNAAGVAGTAMYMAPEQIEGKPVRASDQYALAVIIYEWLSGTPPFLGTLTELSVQHLTRQPPPLSDHVPGVSEAVEKVLFKALAKDPRERYANIKEFAEALQQVNKPPIGTTFSVLRGHTDWVIALAWSPDGAKLASASNDHTVQVWDAAQAQALYTYHGHAREVTAVAWSPDGTKLASASCEAEVHIWEVTTGKRLLTYQEHTDQVLSLAWSPDGTELASAGSDRAVRIWNASTGRTLSIFSEYGDDVSAVSWSPNGKYLASASYDQQVQVREVASGALQCAYRSHTAAVFAVSWSPDSRRIASASYDRSVQVREIAGCAVLLTHRSHKDGVFALAWSPDGTRLASAGDDRAVHIWYSANGRMQAAYRLHEGGLRCLVWSPDGTRLASGGVDKTIHIWLAS